AAYLDEPNSPNTLSMAYFFDGRPLLSESSGISFDSYPHNLAVYAEFSGIPLRTLASTPLSTLALHFRDALIASRTLTHLKQRHHDDPGALALTRTWGVDGWGFSNQIKAGFDQVDWGSPVRSLSVNSMPLDGDCFPLVNRLEGGITIAMDLRKSRWASIRAEVERVRNGETRLVV
ncbi:hypothetical protein MNV49_001471, partial [Pseudohyphozyma bogoriensis]